MGVGVLWDIRWNMVVGVRCGRCTGLGLKSVQKYSRNRSTFSTCGLKSQPQITQISHIFTQLNIRIYII